MNRYNQFLIVPVFCMYVQFHAYAQTPAVSEFVADTALRGLHDPETDKTYENKKIKLNPLPRAVECTYEYYGNTGISDTPVSKDLDPGHETTTHSRLELKLKVPVFLGKTTQVIVGGKYAFDRFSFMDGTDSPIYTSLQKRPSKTRTVTLYLNKSFTGSYSLSTRTEAGLLGDHRFLGFEHSYKISQSALFSVCRNENLAYGIGLYYSLQNKRQSLYPVVYYQRNFGSSTGVSTMFPANAYLNWAPSDRVFVQAGYEVGSLSCALGQPDALEPTLNSAYFRRMEMRPQLKVDWELYDFIWAAAVIGWSKTLKSDVQEQNESERRRLSDIHHGNPLFLSASIYLTIPRKYRSRV